LEEKFTVSFLVATAGEGWDNDDGDDDDDDGVTGEGEGFLLWL